MASYNVHGGVGVDGRFSPERIATVVAEIGADVIGMQEVHLGAGAFDMLAYIVERTGMQVVSGPTLTRPTHGEYGNALLTRHKVVSARRLDLAVTGREPRGAPDVVRRSSQHRRFPRRRIVLSCAATCSRKRLRTRRATNWPFPPIETRCALLRGGVMPIST